MGIMFRRFFFVDISIYVIYALPSIALSMIAPSCLAGELTGAEVDLKVDSDISILLSEVTGKFSKEDMAVDLGYKLSSEYPAIPVDSNEYVILYKAITPYSGNSSRPELDYSEYHDSISHEVVTFDAIGSFKTRGNGSNDCYPEYKLSKLAISSGWNPEEKTFIGHGYRTIMKKDNLILGVLIEGPVSQADSSTGAQPDPDIDVFTGACVRAFSISVSSVQ